MKDLHEEIKKLMENIPAKFIISEQGINNEILKEYTEQSDSFTRSELSEDDTLFISSALFKKNIPIKTKKEALLLLSHVDNITAYREIEKYCNCPDEELKDWALLALQESRMFLETSLDEENHGFISTGLGGIGNRLRYYFLILPSTEKPFTDLQKNIIRDELTDACTRTDSIIEKIDYGETYTGLTILIPMDVNVEAVMEAGLRKCYEYGDFIHRDYHVANTGIPDDKEIQDLIKILREGNW